MSRAGRTRQTTRGPRGNAAPLIKCVYCLEEKPREQFNRDHVMPELLGRFRNNLVLRGIVCAACNSTLGEQTETVLGRGSFEGIVRYDQGVKNPQSARKLMRDRVPIRLARGTDHAGLRVDVIADRGLRYRPAPQVSVQHPLEPAPRYLTEEEFLARPEHEIAGCEIHIITAEGGPEHDRLIRIVKERIPDFEPPPPRTERGMRQLQLEFTQVLDHALTRAYAKIAFNYLAYVAGPEFVLHGVFDPIRRFIRWSEGVPHDFVQVDDEPILAEEAPHRRLQRHHLLAVQWEGTTRHGQDWIHARVAPFNLLTYHVRLCSGFTGVWRDINSGHRFDLDAREAHELRSYSRYLLP